MSIVTSESEVKMPNGIKNREKSLAETLKKGGGKTVKNPQEVVVVCLRRRPFPLSDEKQKMEKDHLRYVSENYTRMQMGETLTASITDIANRIDIYQLLSAPRIKLVTDQMAITYKSEKETTEKYKLMLAKLEEQEDSKLSDNDRAKIGIIAELLKKVIQQCEHMQNQVEMSRRGLWKLLDLHKAPVKEIIHLYRSKPSAGHPWLYYG